MFESMPFGDLVTALETHVFDVSDDDDRDVRMGSEEIDAVVAAERLERWAASVRAAAVARLDAKRRATLDREARKRGTWIDDATVARSIVTEVAMARQTSASAAEGLYGFAVALPHHPRAAALLAGGQVSERVARAVVDQTWPLSRGGRGWVDDQIAPDLPDLTARRAADAARRLVQTYDPHAAHVRAIDARNHRRVGARSQPDVMSDLTLYAGAEQVVACYAALDGTARGLKADGDARTIGQIMADTAVERLTGLSCADATPVEVGLVMRPETMFADEDTPALLAGYGPIPAETARQMLGSTQDWVRRLFTDPADTTVVERDSRRRRFDGPLRDLIRAADQHCMRPWCDCRIRDIDHRTPFAQDGPTVRDNADAYCRRSHGTRHLPGWSTRRDGPTAPLAWTTPTGHTYLSRRPRPLGHGPLPVVANTRAGQSLPERHLRKLLGSHGRLRR